VVVNIREWIARSHSLASRMERGRPDYSAAARAALRRMLTHALAVHVDHWVWDRTGRTAVRAAPTPEVSPDVELEQRGVRFRTALQVDTDTSQE
jgi:hypothetical protein